MLADAGLFCLVSDLREGETHLFTQRRGAGGEAAVRGTRAHPGDLQFGLCYLDFAATLGRGDLREVPLRLSGVCTPSGLKRTSF